MLFVEFLSGVRVKFGHLQTVDFESRPVNVVHQLAHVHIAVGLDKRKSTLALVFKMVAGLDIPVICNF